MTSDDALKLTPGQEVYVARFQVNPLGVVARISTVKVQAIEPPSSTGMEADPIEIVTMTHIVAGTERIPATACFVDEMGAYDYLCDRIRHRINAYAAALAALPLPARNPGT